jgi:integrase/recombinase XerD
MPESLGSTAKLLGALDARTFITTALENGAQLEDVQKAAGHRDPSTTRLYDRRGYNPEKAASFFATY